MSSSKKQNKNMKKKSKKTKKKDVDNVLFTNPPVLSQEQKEFYLDQIKSLETRLIRYVLHCTSCSEICITSFCENFTNFIINSCIFDCTWNSKWFAI